MTKRPQRAHHPICSIISYLVAFLESLNVRIFVFSQMSDCFFRKSPMLRSKRLLIPFVLLIAVAAYTVYAGSTNANFVAFVLSTDVDGNNCALNDGSTFFQLRIAYNSAEDFDYTLTILNGGGLVSGTFNGSLPAGSSSSTQITPTFATSEAYPPFAFTVQIETFIKGEPQDTATARVECSGDMNGNVYAVTPLTGENPFAARRAADNCSHLRDQRINSDPSRDCAAPIAVYVDEFGIKIYGVNPYDSTGLIALFIPVEAIDALGVPTENTLIGETTLLASGRELRVYRLTSGEFQLDTFYADGKPYRIIWDQNGVLVRHVEA